MAQKVLLVANPQGVDAITIGKEGTIIKKFFDKALIQFTNEFGELEEWYFLNNEFRNL
jgi:hypothetical protein